MEIKKLCKSSTDKVLFGVCGGLAEYFGIDSLIIRLLFVLLAVFVGSGLLLYIICAILIPDEAKAARDAEAQRAYYAQQSSPYGSADDSQARNYSYGAPSYQQEKPAEAQDVNRNVHPDLAKAAMHGSAAEAKPEHTSYQDRAAYAAPESKTTVDPETVKTKEAPKAQPAQGSQTFRQEAYSQQVHFNQNARSANASRDSKVLGIILVAMGGLILLKYLVPRISTTVIVAAALIIAGLYLMLRKR